LDDDLVVNLERGLVEMMVVEMAALKVVKKVFLLVVWLVVSLAVLMVVR